LIAKTSKVKALNISFSQKKKKIGLCSDPMNIVNPLLLNIHLNKSCGKFVPWGEQAILEQDLAIVKIYILTINVDWMPQVLNAQVTKSMN